MEAADLANHPPAKSGNLLRLRSKCQCRSLFVSRLHLRPDFGLQGSSIKHRMVSARAITHGHFMGWIMADMTLKMHSAPHHFHFHRTIRHTRTVVSRLAEITFVPSGENTAENTTSVCPCSVCSHSPVATSHTRTAPS